VASAQAEREARARGDVNQGRLAVAAGALLGAGLMLELGAAQAGARIAALAAVTLTPTGDAGAALRGAFSLSTALAAPVLVGTLAGALIAGLLQTRAYLGWPRDPHLPEHAEPSPSVTFFGWCALTLLLLDLLRGAMGLAMVADAVPLGLAAASLARELGRAFLVGVVALAAIDHLLRRRRRSARLEAAERPAGGVAFRGGPDEPPVESLLVGVERVLFDVDVAVTFGRRDGAWWAFSRARGLAARALLDAARRGRVSVRGVPALATLESVTLGAPLDAAQIAELVLEATA
jgi:hypothetical protein